MTTESIVPIAFDYASLDAETRIMVQRRTGEIKTLMSRTAQDIIDIGTMLLEVKGHLGHGHFGTWLAAEFDWSESTALRMMQVAEAFKSVTVTDLNIGTKALYALAAPSTPEVARLEAIERAQGGEAITHTTVRQIVGTRTPHKPAPLSGGAVGKSATLDYSNQEAEEAAPSDVFTSHPPEVVERVGKWDNLFQLWEQSLLQPARALAKDRGLAQWPPLMRQQRHQLAMRMRALATGWEMVLEGAQEPAVRRAVARQAWQRVDMQACDCESVDDVKDLFGTDDIGDALAMISNMEKALADIQMILKPRPARARGSGVN